MDYDTLISLAPQVLISCIICLFIVWLFYHTSATIEDSSIDDEEEQPMEKEIDHDVLLNLRQETSLEKELGQKEEIQSKQTDGTDAEEEKSMEKEDNQILLHLRQETEEELCLKDEMQSKHMDGTDGGENQSYVKEVDSQILYDSRGQASLAEEIDQEKERQSIPNESRDVGEDQSEAKEVASQTLYNFHRKTREEGKEVDQNKETQPMRNERTDECSQQTVYATDEDEDGTDIDTATKRSETFSAIIKILGWKELEEKKITISDSMRVNSSHISGKEHNCVLENFIAKLASYDYRVQQVNIYMNEQNAVGPNETSEEDDSEDWTSSPADEDYQGGNETAYYSRDILYVILNCLDPFFLQEVLMKLSACQIAVPVLLPDKSGNNVKFLLWGLRRIVKSWCDDKNSSSIREETIVRHDMLTVAAVRIGKLPVSKSNILNKLLGPTQGNDEHAFFISFEQDSRPKALSDGILECVWFLPGTEIGPISSPFALLNLRGDYLKHNRQAKFAVEMAFITVVFIDSDLMKTYKTLVEKIRLTSHVIVVCCQNSLRMAGRKNFSRTFEKATHQLTQILSAGMSALEISAEISKVIKDLIKKKTLKVSCLETSVTIAQNLSLEIDEANEECKEARQLALEVFEEIKTLSPDEYKLKHFRLQELWKDWSQNGKIKRWDATSENLETEKAEHEQKQKNIRLAQADKELSPHLQKICSFLLKGSKRRRQFFFFWLQIHLNDISTHFLKPLRKQLIEKSSQRRELSNTINTMEETLKSGRNTKIDNKELSPEEEEEKIGEDERELINQFDKKSLGVEHYMREFGQLVESYHYSKKKNPSNSFYINELPKHAAEMLMSGQPLEILDGDVSDVPIVWLKEVICALVNLIKKDATVYVISVLGIQSSGKSTLLNSMFGVRFAASAGRCTRGVFIQLLPIEGKVREQLNCEYLVIVDTEGLRAPEKSLSSYTHQDNELATFALCISNLTLINIGGQTMGEDMTNVLQIAAHAFVRMTQVNLKPECRIIQQFVADVTADQKNETAMQTILMKLDEAAREAAKKERKEHLYRQFSDVFSVQNYTSDATNVQYIPSLWRGFMGAPDYQYSLRVQQLKSTILQSIPPKNLSPLTLKEFHQRISDVWNAIKKEDFVFSFQNTKEVTLYQEVTYFYKDLIQPIRRELIEMELSAKNSIENAEADEIDDIIEKSLSEIKDILEERCRNVGKKLRAKCEEKRYETVRKYSNYFETDLQVLQGRSENSIRSTFARHGTVTKSAHKKDSVLRSLSVEIQNKFAEFAHTLRNQTDEVLGGGDANDVNKIIETKFEAQWTKMMQNVKKVYPLRSLQEITKEIKRKILRILKDIVGYSDLTKEADELLKGNIHMYSSQPAEISSEHIENLKTLFSSIDAKSEKSFKSLFHEVTKIAADVRMFQSNVPIVLRKIEAFMIANKSINNGKFILLYICSQFLIHAQRAQQTEELNILNTSRSSASVVCKEMHILEKEQIKPELINCIINRLRDKKRAGKLKLELEELADDLIDSKEEKENQSLMSRMLHKVPWWSDSTKGLSEIEAKMKKDLATILYDHDGKCSKEAVQTFANTLITNLYDKNVPASKDKHDPFKYYFKVGETAFVEVYFKCLQKHVIANEYQIKFAEPQLFSSLKSKVDFLLTNMKEHCIEEHLQFLKEELHTENVFKLDTIPLVYPSLQRLDFPFIQILPKMATSDIESVTNIIDSVKSSILTTAQPKGTFYEDSFARHAEDMFQKTNNKLENTVRAAVILHVGVWSLPVYARRQFDFEKEKNIAFLIQADKKMFETEFKSLASNCQDEMVAERFIEVVEITLKDGLMTILYPILYSSILNDHTEFRSKKTFIGSVLKNLFEKEEISGIAQFLSGFTRFSKLWILRFVAKKIKNNPAWLQSHMTQCVKSLINSTKLTMHEVSKEFTGTSGDSFSDMLDMFVTKFKSYSKLTCKNADIDKLKRRLNLNDINKFIEKCNELLDKLEETWKGHSSLPAHYEEVPITNWLLSALPKAIFEDLFDSFKGCEEQCPFCRAVCDENLSKHPKHECLCHVPSGLTGSSFINTHKLSSYICNSAVDSTLAYKTKHGDPEWRSFKDYEKDFSEWYIRPQESNEPFLFWKHLFAKYNKTFAEVHKKNEADIPQPWVEINDKDALKSLSDIYNLPNE